MGSVTSNGSGLSARTGQPISGSGHTPPGAPPAPPVTSESVEADAKERAAAVVQAWRAVDFVAAERGEAAALAALRAACEA